MQAITAAQTSNGRQPDSSTVSQILEEEEESSPPVVSNREEVPISLEPKIPGAVGDLPVIKPPVPPAVMVDMSSELENTVPKAEEKSSVLIVDDNPINIKVQLQHNAFRQVKC